MMSCTESRIRRPVTPPHARAARGWVPVFALALTLAFGPMPGSATVARGQTAAPPRETPAPAGQPSKGTPSEAGAPDQQRSKGDQFVKALDFMPIGSTSARVVVPEHDETGALKARYCMDSVHRRDRTTLIIERLTISLTQPPPHDAVTVDFPSAAFDMDTQVLTGDKDVTIRRDDFILRGKRAEFDTRTRRGKVTGDIHMTIWNKDVVGEAKEKKSDAPTSNP